LWGDAFETFLTFIIVCTTLKTTRFSGCFKNAVRIFSCENRLQKPPQPGDRYANWTMRYSGGR
jgi:hypothetical protein